MEEVQEQFRKLSKLYHPDRFSGGDAKFKAINAAYRQIQEQQKNPHQQSTDTNSEYPDHGAPPRARREGFDAEFYRLERMFVIFAATLGFTGIMALTTDMEGWVQTYKRNKPYMAALIVLI
jgi:DnaJ-class molecular chaperone